MVGYDDCTDFPLTNTSGNNSIIYKMVLPPPDTKLDVNLRKVAEGDVNKFFPSQRKMIRRMENREQVRFRNFHIKRDVR